MDLKKIKQLINLVEEAEISHFSIEENVTDGKGMKIEIKKEAQGVAVETMPQQITLPSNPVTPVAAAPAPVNNDSQEAKPASDSNLIEIKAEMVGTFYRSSGPDAAAFVSVGDTITKGKVICIIEAMKLFNEIESDMDGTITEICVENETPVEFGQVLFKVKP